MLVDEDVWGLMLWGIRMRSRGVIETGICRADLINLCIGVIWVIVFGPEVIHSKRMLRFITSFQMIYL